MEGGGGLWWSSLTSWAIGVGMTSWGWEMLISGGNLQGCGLVSPEIWVGVTYRGWGSLVFPDQLG